jgi:hypothetical protein
VACWTGLEISERELMFESKDQALVVAGVLAAEGVIREQSPEMNEEHAQWAILLPDCLRQVVDHFDLGELHPRDLSVDAFEAVSDVDRRAA